MAFGAAVFHTVLKSSYDKENLSDLQQQLGLMNNFILGRYIELHSCELCSPPFELRYNYSKDMMQSLRVCILRSWLRYQADGKERCWRMVEVGQYLEQRRQKWREELDAGEGTSMSDTPEKLIVLLPGSEQSKTISKTGWG